MKKKDILIMLLLCMLPLLILIFILPSSKLFGSDIDWLSQHISISDYFRNQFLETGNLFPDFAPHLGAGVNIYSFSYYGLFRPDILISYLIPVIEMKTIIITYSISLLILGCNLCYFWLRRKHFSVSISLFVAILLLSSSFFFQSHRQIMFVNYIPFLIMAFISIDHFIKKNKMTPFIVSLVLIILHSYFFSIAAIIMCCIYYIYQLFLIKHTFKEGRKQIIHFSFSIIIAIMISGVLLLPTAFVILENSKHVASTPLWDILLPKFNFDGLLYDKYGCGFTMLVYVLLILGLQHQRTRKLCFVLLIAFTCPLIAYLLNGTLYVRNKALISIIPLLLWIVAEVLTLLKRNEISTPLWSVPLMIIPIFFYEHKMFILIDVMIALSISYKYSASKKPILLFSYLIIPAVVFTNVNATNLFLDRQLYQQVNDEDKEALLNKRPLVQRTADFTNNLHTSNRVYHTDQYKTSSYTSTNHTLYNTFLYDIMKSPISIANRVANLDNSNIFIQGMLGVRSIITKNKIPIGYHKVAENDQYQLVQNEHVMPIAYATQHLISEDTFDTLTYPYTLDTIYTQAIVNKKWNHNYQSQIKKETIEPQVMLQDDSLTITKTEKGYTIEATEKSSLRLKLNRQNQSQILLLDFMIDHVKDASTNETVIIINQIQNKLSKGNAPYPNGNHHFTFIISQNEGIDELDITFSKGIYQIADINLYSLDYEVIKDRAKEVTPLNTVATRDNEVLKGNIDNPQDGYFITSLPYQKGWRAYVDNKEVEVELVNKAFMGFPITKGKHQILITFSAPYKNLGLIFTGIGCLSLIMIFIIERSKNHEK